MEEENKEREEKEKKEKENKEREEKEEEKCRKDEESLITPPTSIVEKESLKIDCNTLNPSFTEIVMVTLLPKNLKNNTLCCCCLAWAMNNTK